MHELISFFFQNSNKNSAWLIIVSVIDHPLNGVCVGIYTFIETYLFNNNLLIAIILLRCLTIHLTWLIQAVYNSICRLSSGGFDPIRSTDVSWITQLLHLNDQGDFSQLINRVTNLLNDQTWPQRHSLIIGLNK